MSSDGLNLLEPDEIRGRLSVAREVALATMYRIGRGEATAGPSIHSGRFRELGREMVRVICR